MSEGRIATELWVMAHIRQCSAQGIMATVVKRGDDWGGAVVIKVNLLGPGFRETSRADAGRLFIRHFELPGPGLAPLRLRELKDARLNFRSAGVLLDGIGPG